MRQIFTFFLFSIIFLSNINYSYSIEPDIFIQSTVNRAASTLSGDLSKDDRIEKLKQIAMETVDINGIGLYSLGSHRKSLNKNQLSDYKTVFKKYFLKSLTSRLTDYSSNKFEVISAEKKSSNYTIVKSKIIANEHLPPSGR